MKYKKAIESYFKIDEPKTGQLVPFILNKVQSKYYNELVNDYDIENKGLNVPVREKILKARREGFSSLILALFAADDIFSDNPTETCIISYKDEATKVFSKRYKNYILSAFEAKYGIKDSKAVFEVDNGNELVLKHNKARFFCGTANARVAGRGGVVQKLLFSESAHYPDGDILTAKEIIEGTMRQVDINAGWIFSESTANGFGNHYEKMWTLASKGESRFKPRFYGWQEFYTPEEFEIISSEFVDKNMLMQEYPRTPEEAFIASGSSYFDNNRIFELIKRAEEPSLVGMLDDRGIFTPMVTGKLKIWHKPLPEASYVMGGDVAEGIEGGDYSVLKVIDNKTLKTVAKWKGHCRPDELSTISFNLGKWYNYAYIGIEANKDGLWTNDELNKQRYPNIYYREVIDSITKQVGKQLGFKTDMKSRPYILTELMKLISTQDCWNDKEFLEECLTFVRNRVGRPEAMSGKNDDDIIATAIAYEIRRNMPVSYEVKQLYTPNELSVLTRLERLYGKKNNKVLGQLDYF